MVVHGLKIGLVDNSGKIFATLGIFTFSLLMNGKRPKRDWPIMTFGPKLIFLAKNFLILFYPKC